MGAAARFVAQTLAVAALYWAAGSAEALASSPAPTRGAVWWAAGVGVAAVYLCGPRAAVGVMLGEWLTASATTMSSWWLGVFSGVGNGLEAVLGAWLLRRLRFRPNLDRTRDVWVLVVAAAACPVALVAFQTPAAAAAGWFRGADWTAVPRAVAHWWTNDAIGVLYLVPLAVAVCAPRATAAEVGGRWVEAVGLVCGLLVVTGLAFGTGPGDWLAGLTAAAFPFLAWAGLRFGPRVTALALSAHAAVIVLFIARRLDPFSRTDADCFPFLHLLFGVSAVSALLLAAAVRQRTEAERRAAEARHWEGLGVLAGGLAHDLNNRLTVVLGSAELAAAELPPNSPAVPLLAAAARDANHLAELVRNLLAYTGRGALPMAARAVDFAAVVRQAVEEMSPTVRVEVEGTGAALTAPADPGLVRLAVTNLVTNALEATGGAAAAVRVGVSAETITEAQASFACPLPARAGAHVRVRVADSGCGMATAVMWHMFDPFYSTRGPGRGLGLAAVLGAVRAVGGFIRTDSAVGRGTTVDLYFPRNPLPDEPQQLG